MVLGNSHALFLWSIGDISEPGNFNMDLSCQPMGPFCVCVFFFFPNKSMQEDLLGDSLPVKDLTNGFIKLIPRAALSHLESDDLFWLGQKCQILKNRDVTKLYYC